MAVWKSLKTNHPLKMCVENTIRFEDKALRGKNPCYYNLW